MIQRQRIYVFASNIWHSQAWASDHSLALRQIFHIRDEYDLHGLRGITFIELPSACHRRDRHRIREMLENRVQGIEIKTGEQLEDWKQSQQLQPAKP